jgi:cyanate permease
MERISVVIVTRARREERSTASPPPVLELYIVALEVGFFAAQIAPLMGAIHDRTGAGIGQLGIVASSWVLAHALIQPLAGAFADRFGTSVVLTTGLTIMAGGAVAFSAATSLLFMAASRFILGIGTGAAFVAGLRALGSAEESRQMAFVRGLYGASPNLGYTTALLFVPLLYATYGWTRGILLQAVVAVALAIVAWISPLQRYQRTGATAVASTDGIQSHGYQTLIMAIAHFAGNGMSVAIVTWGVEFLTRVYNQSLVFGSVAVAAASFIGFVGRVSSGLLLLATGVYAGLLISMGGASLGLAALAIAQGSVFPIVSLVVICLASNLSFAPIFSPRAPSDPGLGRKFGIVSLSGNLGGFAMVALIGFVVERTGSFSTAWVALAVIFGILGALIGLLWGKNGNLNRRSYLLRPKA